MGGAGQAPARREGGGRSEYVYVLSDVGAQVLAALAGIPRADIPTVAGPE